MRLRTLQLHAICLLVLAIPFAMECGAAVSTPGAMDSFHQNGDGYLGVVFENLNSQQRAALQVPARQGVAIAAVDHDAPAGTAGLRSNDVIVQMNGKKTEHAEEVREALHKMSPGQTVTLQVLREGRPLQIKVVLADRKTVEQRAWAQHYIVPDPRMQAVVAADEGARPDPSSRAGAKNSMVSVAPNAGHSDPQSSQSSPSPGILGAVPAEIGKTLGSNGGLMSYIPYTAPYTGITVDVLTPQLAKFFGLKDTTGLLVKNIDPKSPGERAGVQAGDVISKANDTPMTSRSKWIHALRGNRHDAVKLQILRNRQTQVVLLTLAASKS
ncbi:MAG TPA: PDZ domain-containing protein [Acidobacteriaceae bacterium]|nr:PDZ domain-containing protein [Acidobacteriaceae bacterium]